MKLKIMPMMLRRFFGFFFLFGAGAPGWPVAPAVVFTPSVEIWRSLLGFYGNRLLWSVSKRTAKAVTQNRTML